MKSLAQIATDARQFPMWGQYLSAMGWKIAKVGDIQIFIRYLPLLRSSLIKIQHPQGKIDFPKIDQLAKKEKALCVVFEPIDTGFDDSMFKKNGYQNSKMRFSHTATIRIDLQPSNPKIFKSFSENARRNIKKSQNLGITTKTFFLNTKTSDQKFAEFFKLLKNLSVIKKFYTPPMKEYLDRLEAFRNNSFLVIAYQSNSTEPIAGVWYLFYKQTLVYSQVGMTQIGYDNLVNYLLVWEGIKQGKKLGLKVMDFEAIYDDRYPKDHPKWSNFSEFKSRFHGEKVLYPPVQIKIYNPLFKLIYLCNNLLLG